MSDTSLDILIRTLAETAGADKVQEALDRTKTAVDKAGKAHEEAGKKVEKHENHHKALHKVMMSINEFLPGFGAVFAFTMGTAAGAASLLELGVKAVVKQIEKLSEVYRERLATTVAVWRAQLDGAEAARASAASYADTLHRIAATQDTMKEKEDKELAVLKAIEESRKRILEAQMAAEKAAAGGDKEKEAEIERRYGKAKTAGELEAAAAEISVKEGFLTQERGKANADYAAMGSAQAALQANMANPGAVEAQRWLETHKDDLAKAMEARDKAKALASAPVYGAFGPTEPIVHQRRQAAAEAEAKVADLQKREQDARAQVEAQRVERERLEKASKETAERFEKSHGQVTAREAELEKDRAVFGVRSRTAGEVESARMAAELGSAGLKPGSVLGRTVLRGIEAEEARANGQMMNAEQAKGIQQLVAALKLAGNSQQQINALIAGMMDLHKAHSEKLQDVMAALNQMKQQAKTGRLNTGG